MSYFLFVLSLCKYSIYIYMHIYLYKLNFSVSIRTFLEHWSILNSLPQKIHSFHFPVTKDTNSNSIIRHPCTWFYLPSLSQSKTSTLTVLEQKEKIFLQPLSSSIRELLGFYNSYNSWHNDLWYSRFTLMCELCICAWTSFQK